MYYILLSISLSVLYVSLSGSRSCLVAVVVAAIILTVLMTYRKRKERVAAGETDKKTETDKTESAVTRLAEKAAPIGGNAFRTYGVRLLLVLATLAVLYFGLPFAMQQVGAIITPGRDTERELERDDVDMENISNNRFDIWMEYLSIVKDRPLWGFSTRGALPYIREVQPTAYISEKGYNPHSMFVQMLVQNGVVGFLLMMVFLVRALIRTWKRCVREKPLSRLFLLGLFWVLIHGVFCVFNVGLFITPCLEAMLAWIGLGYMEQESYDVASE